LWCGVYVSGVCVSSVGVGCRFWVVVVVGWLCWVCMGFWGLHVFGVWVARWAGFGFCGGGFFLVFGVCEAFRVRHGVVVVVWFGVWMILRC